MRGGAASLLGVWMAAAGAAPPPLLDEAAEGWRVSEGWRAVGLPGQKAPLTRFTAAVIEGVPALRVESVKSYGNLVHRLAPPLAARALQWRWRLDRGNPRADLSEKSGDDVALRVCLSFALPLAQLPFVERQVQRIAQAAAGEALPTATLCYIWDARLAPGTLLPNVYSTRVRYIVLRGPADALAQWQHEQRDVAADFLRAFGDESPTLLPVDMLMVGADSDNTQMSTAGAVAGLRLQ